MYQTNTGKKAETNGLDVHWQEELRNNVTSEELEDFIAFHGSEKAELSRAVDRHPLNISRYDHERINPNDPGDPGRKLAVPSPDELIWQQRHARPRHREESSRIAVRQLTGNGG